jgi:hypothetical protein
MHDTTIVIESIDEWITFDIADTLNDWTLKYVMIPVGESEWHRPFCSFV